MPRLPEYDENFEHASYFLPHLEAAVTVTYFKRIIYHKDHLSLQNVEERLTQIKSSTSNV